MTTHPEHLDVLVIGAGISGIGAARYLLAERPGTTFAVLEARAASGGTWDLFRYPGIRSDSDLHTFGYEFKPWTDPKSIASADRILAYLRETSEEYGVEPHIRYQHRVLEAAWSTADARWTVQVERGDTGERFTLTAGWVFGATGYYDYEAGFTPTFEGRDRFRGEIVHPQHWPEDLDYAGKRVVVIGSGATAVTLLPAMVEGGAGHVTMLQRTPTYIMPVPSEDKLANGLRKVLGETRGYAVARQKNILKQRLVWQFCQTFPKTARTLIRSVNAKALPEGFDVDTHFNPPYDPWDQRLCAVPDGDLFRTIRDGRASVVTDRISTFTETGILLESGEELEADVIVTATGLNMQLFGGIAITVDGTALHAPDHVAYKGMMLSGIPNLAFAIGYTNSSWTLKVGLLCEHFCRLLEHMEAEGYDVCVPVAPEGMATRPLLDFEAGYVQRAIADLPRQGDRYPWTMSMSYADDVKLVRGGPVVDEALRFSTASPAWATTASNEAVPA
ncbi:cation diffusion facilitator CzcD-associated flavoprotein CzcO [Nocardioides aromaticivorans]|uniref:Cation diffusion facilitator CzcD-associated flavoprotein CzcO n=1 Tax=Nocardioides aromaticivorans TaxID=200618 RepID=A0A7Y9ZG09_9ACTN|nr:NAD(P)/FAD-dependent oxidoreductase [Nocardioides aromaticivorans]NYI44769.1 cation diffusion facilitator CzcD-associated flavoprotein CzcO [Nocardioides aromaticivorans]